ncbi:MAG TPA: DUF948 domain-containing protein [Mycobacteriales bacterium]
MTPGEIAGLVAAGTFLLLVLILAVPLLKLGRTADQATRALGQIADALGPTLANVNTTIDGVNETLVGVNGQLAKVDTMTTHVQQLTTNVASLSSLVAATVGGPMVKVAAFTYGVRNAVKGRQKSDLDREVAERIMAERKARHRRGDA